MNTENIETGGSAANQVTTTTTIEQTPGKSTGKLEALEKLEREVIQLTNFLSSHWDQGVVESAVTRYIVKLPTENRSRIISNVMVSIVSNGGTIK